MDPDAVLAAFWHAFTDALEMAEGTPEREAELDAAAQAAADLFEWLQTGGFTPHRWTAKV